MPPENHSFAASASVALDEDKIVAAILAAAWFQKFGLENSAKNREQFVREYKAILGLLQNPTT